MAYARGMRPGSPVRPEQAPQGQWSRVFWLDRQIRDGRYPNIRSLYEEFGTKRRAALETVRFMRESLHAPIAFSRTRGGYHYTDPAYGLPAVFLAEGELLALLLAEEVSRQYLGTPLEAPLREAVEKLSRYLPEDVRVELGHVADSFQFAGGGGVEVPFRLLTDLRRAVRERRVIWMLYYTASRDETGEREVEPHFLRNVRGDWMLVAWDRGRQDAREFMLSRIQEYTVRDGRFHPRPELSPDRYTRDVFLTEHGSGEPYGVALRFDAYQARWIRERTWHPSQQVEERPDGGLVLRLTVSGQGDLLRWILGYGSHVEVLEPEWLRERVAEELRKAWQTYGQAIGDRSDNPTVRLRGA